MVGNTWWSGVPALIIISLPPSWVVSWCPWYGRGCGRSSITPLTHTWLCSLTALNSQKSTHYLAIFDQVCVSSSFLLWFCSAPTIKDLFEGLPSVICSIACACNLNLVSVRCVFILWFWLVFEYIHVPLISLGTWQCSLFLLIYLD